MVRIRMQRLGRKNLPFYRINAVEKKTRRNGPVIEALGYFDPLANDPANWPVYVHCKGGKHRAGVTGAVYRFTKYGWDYDKVYAEMLKFNFDTSYGRKVMKTFVEDYAAKMKNTSSVAAH